MKTPVALIAATLTVIFAASASAAGLDAPSDPVVLAVAGNRCE